MPIPQNGQTHSNNMLVIGIMLVIMGLVHKALMQVELDIYVSYKIQHAAFLVAIFVWIEADNIYLVTEIKWQRRDDGIHKDAVRLVLSVKEMFYNAKKLRMLWA